MKRLFIDSDIFVRDLRYRRDSRLEPNSRFLEKVRTGELAGATSIFNLLEVCGILSFNLPPQELNDLYVGFARQYNVKILFPADDRGNLQYNVATIFGQIRRRQALGDAEISYVVDRFTDHLSEFVSWNAPHFEGKISVPAKNPGDF